MCLVPECHVRPSLEMLLLSYAISIDSGCSILNDSEKSGNFRMCIEKKITQTTRTTGRIGGLKNTSIPPPSSRRHSGRKRVRTSSLVCPPQTLDQDACLKNQRSNRKAITPATHQQRADSNTITSRLLWPAADKCAAGRRDGQGGGFQR